MELLKREDALALRCEALRVFHSVHGRGGEESTETLEVASRRLLHDFVAGVMEVPAGRHLVGHRPFTSSVVVKHRGDESAAHRDWTFCDEAEFRSLSLWMPLQDIDATNGPLSVVPMSHCGQVPIRTNPGVIPDPASPPASALVPLCVPAGTAIAFDHALYHGAPPNGSERPRVALVLAVAPASAELRHYWRRPDGAVEMYRVTDVEFFRQCRPGVLAAGPTVELAGVVEPAPWR